ncbi:hypothetical protein P6P37_16660 [Clostridium perfringens]|uniref:putative holin-like toxin n=1 Tax=Clostridium perfringens TaxID=1502 RepID=UPI00016BD8A8|nr:hypothetical protein [Clostridium perfringens]MDK0554365.1 hypothetical protein [Clostridium perfringens]
MSNDNLMLLFTGGMFLLALLTFIVLLIGVASGKCGFTTLREIKLVFSMLCRFLYKFYFLSNLSKIESLNYFQDKSYGTV